MQVGGLTKHRPLTWEATVSFLSQTESQCARCVNRQLTTKMFPIKVALTAFSAAPKWIKKKTSNAALNNQVSLWLQLL